jgi:hypothetical protein
VQLVSVEELLAEALQGEADMSTLEQRLLMAGGYCPPRLFGVDPTVPFTAGTRVPANTLQQARENALRSYDARTAAAMDAAAAELEQDARDAHEQRMRQLRLHHAPHSDDGGAEKPQWCRVTLTEQCAAALAALDVSQLPPVVSVEWLVETLTGLVHRTGEWLVCGRSAHTVRRALPIARSDAGVGWR